MITRFDCAACGEARLGETSVGGKCPQCGAPICYICWSGFGRRQCASHRPAGSESAHPKDGSSRRGPETSKSACRRVLEEKFFKYGRTRVSVEETAAETGLDMRTVESELAAYAADQGFRIIRRRGRTILSRE